MRRFVLCAIWGIGISTPVGCVYGDFEKLDVHDTGGSAGSGGSASGGTTSSGGKNLGGRIGSAGDTQAGEAGNMSAGQAGSSAAGAAGEAGSSGGAPPGDQNHAGASGADAGAGGTVSDPCAGISACVSGDGCCPLGCNTNVDADCARRCGNGAIETGETCDPPGSCPASCADTKACTIDSSTGAAETCDLSCKHTPIVDCSGGDGCCPIGCNANTDSDCAAVCSNNVREPGETCDPPSSCPATCDDGNVCTTDTTSGTAEACTLACDHTLTSCLCTQANGCISDVSAEVSGSAPPTTAGAPGNAVDGNETSDYRASNSGSSSVSLNLTSRIVLAASTSVDWIELVATAGGGGGGPSGGGGGGYAIKVEVRNSAGGVSLVYDVTGSGSVSSGLNTRSVNTRIQGPFADVASVTVLLSGSGGGSASGGASLVLSEVRIFGLGAWGATK
ncbi:MAG: hypothetical protein ACOY0T_33700 [Myxococcota bacterium]